MKTPQTKSSVTKRIRKIETSLGHRIAGCCVLGFCGRDAQEAARRISNLERGGK